MIELTELRIGNIVNIQGTWNADEKGIKPWTIEYFYWVEEGGPWPRESGAEPVPLTEEWLTKFGFQKINGKYEHPDLDHPLVNQGTYYALAVFDPENEDARTDFIGHHEHVHQLQNLYFALTGEELTINPTI